MIRYRKPDGTTFVLAHHDPAEWGDVIAAALARLGCSPAYVERVVQAYREAVPV